VSEVTEPKTVAPAGRRFVLPLVASSDRVRKLIIGVALVLACVLPFVVSSVWLQTLLFAMIAGVGALSLNILLGSTGILAIAPSFFFAIGAYLYAIFSEPSQNAFGQQLYGLGLPPAVAALLAVLATGLLGWLLSPLARRLRELPLAVATLGLIFLALYVLDNANKYTGGSLGREAKTFSIFGFEFDSTKRLFFLALLVLLATWWYVANLLKSRPGRALQAVRDNATAASSLGINVEHYKQRVFVVSGLLGGLCGVLIALAFRHIIPDYFDFFLSVNYLAMVVIGGLGSPLGAVAGALVVTLFPQAIIEWGGFIPGLNRQGYGSGLTAQEVSQICFGIAIVLFLLFQPLGIVGMNKSIADWFASRRSRGKAQPPTAAPAADQV
jgi:branched-chain amino acid transport system permease protein